MEDNACSYCEQDRGEGAIVAAAQCEHFVPSDLCQECPTDQVCTDCWALGHRPKDWRG